MNIRNIIAALALLGLSGGGMTVDFVMEAAIKGSSAMTRMSMDGFQDVTLYSGGTAWTLDEKEKTWSSEGGSSGALGFGLTQTVAMFNPLHEADQTTFEMAVTDIIGKKDRGNSWLKTARKNNGITQEQLSTKSGVPIRLIRAYEQEKINISNAEYGTILKLRTALNCS